MFDNTCDQFVGNKLSIYFGEDKTKSFSFTTKQNSKQTKKLDIKFNVIWDASQMKQHLESQ